MHAFLVTQSYPTLCHPLDCRLPDSSVFEIFQVGILEWVAVFPSSGSSDPGIELRSLSSPALQADSLPAEPPRKPILIIVHAKSLQSCPTLCAPIV